MTEKRSGIPAVAGALALLVVWLAAGLPAQGQGLPGALRAYGRGDCATAISAFELLLEQQPRNIRIRKLLADCQARSGDTEAARASYVEVLKVAPNDVEARRALDGETSSTPEPEPEPEEEVAEADPAERMDPAQRERLRDEGALLAAEALIEDGDLKEAERSLTEIIDRRPDSVIARQRLGEILSGSERFLQAGDMYGKVADLTGESDFQLRSALNYSWAAAHQQAIERYERYVRRRPGDIEARLGLANSLVWAGREAEAAEHYAPYLRMRPDDMDAHLNYARSLLADGRAEEARAATVQIERRRRDDPEVQLLAARALEKMDEPAQALELYEQVLLAEPEQSEARAASERLSSEAELKAAYLAIEEGRAEEALPVFSAILARNPKSDEALLQVARVSAWAEKYPQALDRYREYVARNPGEPEALRELARVELAVPDFPAAQRRFQRLVDGPFGTLEDREGLVQSYLWAGRFDEASAAAESLLEAEPTNAVALDATEKANDQRRDELLAEALRRSADGDFVGSLAAYQDLIREFGSTREIDLATARTSAWAKRYEDSVRAYESYLEKYPDDTPARVELARVREWSGDLERAEEEYLALAGGPERTNPEVLLGLALVADRRGENAFDTVQKFRRVLETDPGNEVALERYEQLGPQVSPSLSFESFNFGNSDDFGLTMNSVGATLPFRGGLKATPFYRLDYFRQARQVGGTVCGGSLTGGANEKALSNQICDVDGEARAHVGGLRLDYASSGVDLSAEVGAARFNLDRNALQGRFRVAARTGTRGRVDLSVARRNASYDVQNVAPLFAGIETDTATLGYEHSLSRRWSAGVLGGLSRYSASDDGAFASNMQRFGAVRLDYQVTESLTAGYYARLTGFREESPAYFSPTSYGSAGGSWSYRKQLADSVSLLVDAQLGYGRIDRPSIGRVSTFEAMFRPEVLWRIQPELALRTSYRYGRGSNSAFRANAYQTNVLEFRLESSFLDRIGPSRRSSGLVIR